MSTMKNIGDKSDNLGHQHLENVKGSSDPSHFIFEINVGKSRIRHRTTLNFNDGIFNRFESIEI